MKKILILVGKTGPQKDKLIKVIGDYVSPGTEVSLDTFSNLTFEIEEGSVRVNISGEDIRTFNLVFLRAIEKDLSFLAGVLACTLEHLGVRYIDKKFLGSKATSDKLTSTVILALEGLLVIPSFFCERKKVDANAQLIVDKLGGYPIVAKEILSHHSKGLLVIREEDDFRHIGGGQFLFQKFIPLSSEYRLLVLGGEVKSAQKMYRDLSGKVSRIDYKRKEEFTDPGEIPDEAKDVAEKGAKALNLQVAGADILFAKEGSTVYLIEVNGNPGFTYDAKISPEIPELARYLERQASA